MSFGWSREIVYWYYHSYILDHHLHQKYKQKDLSLFCHKMVRIKMYS